MPSIANIIGTDMSTYKLISKNQFAYGPVTSRNGDKISIALLEEYENAMVSQAYTVFEVIDKKKLLPEYLMMWFRRPEFDRYARFKSHGSAREIFDWVEMCDTELPIPSFEKQQEIVREYDIIQNRIAINNQLITKLEETAQAIYKQWFVDFEFPHDNGKPYKSNGGEMVWCEELEKEIPEGWNIEEFQKVTDVTSGKSLKWEMGNKYPIYGAGGITGYTDEFLFDKTIIIIGRVGTHGKVFIEYNKSWPTDNTLVFIPKYLCYSYFILKELNYDELNKGGVQALLTQTDLKQIKILLPKFDLNKFENTVKPILLMKKNIDSQNQKLEELKGLLLAKMTKVETKITY
ncbi:restriction modification system DNA specificity domain-containing protein [Flavobacterium seoulense]|uniref:Restriction modification system DNA specificity domain-containing protein n=2 Tax=Flavobacterium seoulense TaxID=1492738 RepID=A0A066WKY9_9FLAO|nr:restriction modification system DNA specificity domain-containing protein [Flavobacterium seoulense]